MIEILTVAVWLAVIGVPIGFWLDDRRRQRISRRRRRASNIAHLEYKLGFTNERPPLDDWQWR